MAMPACQAQQPYGADQTRAHENQVMFGNIVQAEGSKHANTAGQCEGGCVHSRQKGSSIRLCSVHTPATMQPPPSSCSTMCKRHQEPQKPGFFKSASKMDGSRPTSAGSGASSPYELSPSMDPMWGPSALSSGVWGGLLLVAAAALPLTPLAASRCCSRSLAFCAFL